MFVLKFWDIEVGVVIEFILVYSVIVVRVGSIFIMVYFIEFFSIFSRVEVDRVNRVLTVDIFVLVGVYVIGISDSFIGCFVIFRRIFV